MLAAPVSCDLAVHGQQDRATTPRAAARPIRDRCTFRPVEDPCTMGSHAACRIT